jgi:hypothetical protein
MLIKLTRKVESLEKGKYDKWNPVWINIRAIISIMKHPETGETWVSTGPTYHIVKESPEQVLKLIEDMRLAWRGLMS